MEASASYWIDTLKLTKHIEGGFYRQTYSAVDMIPRQALPSRFNGNRPASTAIYFLLESGQFSALHRIAADEVWHFYYGDGLLVYEIRPDGQLLEHKLGNDAANGFSFQCVVKAGSWFGAILQGGGNYALVGCTVAPGFDFDDFELADREGLCAVYPQHESLIHQLTRTNNR